MSMTERLDAFFSPKITLAWKGHFKTKPDGYWPDTIKDRDLLRQFMQEANIEHRNGVFVNADQIDAILAAAGRHGYSVETVGPD
jgi:hypothetical protein